MLAAAASALLGACAALPDDAPVVEQLDTETGVTVARLGRPIELYRETFLQDPAGRFAFLGPFETNQMGKRELFLWIAVPVEPVPDAVPDGRGEWHRARRSARRADARISPACTSRLTRSRRRGARCTTSRSTRPSWRGSAKRRMSTIRVLEPGKNGPIKTLFATKVEADTRLKDFAAR